MNTTKNMECYKDILNDNSEKLQNCVYTYK